MSNSVVYQFHISQ